jgi:hypothetical protein
MPVQCIRLKRTYPGMKLIFVIYLDDVISGVCGGAVDFDTSLQVGGLRVWFPIGSLGFFLYWLNPSCRTMALTLGWLCLWQNYYQGYLLVGKGGRCIWLTILPLLYPDCLEILGVSNSWNPKGLSMPVKETGLPLHLLLFRTWPKCVVVIHKIYRVWELMSVILKVSIWS